MTKKLTPVFFLGTLLVIGLLYFPTLSSGDEEGNEHELEWSFEDVEAGSIPEHWEIAENNGKGTLAKWEVIEADDAPSGKKAFAITKTDNPNRTFNLAIAKETKFKDLEIEVKVKSGTGRMDQGGGPIWRVQDKDNYYIARWNPLEDNFRVYYVKDSKRRQIASADVKTDSSKWHEIKIEMEGNEIEAYFDGKKLIEIKDDTFTDTGMVGLWTKADAATSFDDFEVEPYSEKYKEHEHGDENEHHREEYKDNDDDE